MTQPLLLRCRNPRVAVPPHLLYISPDASHRHYQICCIQGQASESIHQHFVRPRVSTALTRPGVINRGPRLPRGPRDINQQGPVKSDTVAGGSPPLRRFFGAVLSSR